MNAAEFQKVNASRQPGLRGWLPPVLLPFRLVLFAFFQLVFAAGFWIGGSGFDSATSNSQKPIF